MINKKNMIGIYIHLPFCVRKCRYCDFLSFPSKEELIASYVRKVCEEIRMWGRIGGKQGKQEVVRTVYFGGGTPSLLPAFHIEAILRTLREEFAFIDRPEITLECNPGTAATVKFSDYLGMGINRLSMGLQSANDKELEMLGRIHTYKDFCIAYEQARNAGFQNINVDVMSGLPEQTGDDYHRTLSAVIKAAPEHISSYSLIVEEGTVFGKMFSEGRLKLPDEETDRKLYQKTGEYLRAAGYERYEISNYAKQGYESKHNSSYWERIPYLGLGLGASSCYGEIRFCNTPDMQEYLKKNFAEESRRPETMPKEELIVTLSAFYSEVEVLTKQAQMEEFMFLGLRMKKGIDKVLFEKEFGQSYEAVYGTVTEKLEAEGLLNVTENHVTLTERGIDVSNYALAKFLL